MGGGGNAELLSKIASSASGGQQDPAALLPLLMQMMSQRGKGTPAVSPSAASPAPAGGADSEPVSAPVPNGSESRGERPARYFSPILNFADEKIVYHLALLLQ